MTNPFEDENGVYHVLINDEGPAFPFGRASSKSSRAGPSFTNPASRAACLEFINQHWTDMRPKSLIEHMKESSGSEQQEDSRHSDRPSEGQRSELGQQDKTLTEEYGQR